MERLNKKDAMKIWEKIAYLIGVEDAAPIEAACLYLGHEAVSRAVDLHDDAVLMYELPGGEGGYYLTLAGFLHAVTYNNIMNA